MWTLAIETSSARASVAVVRQEAAGCVVVNERRLSERMRHGRGLQLAIDECVEAAGIGKSDLGLLVGGCGPGSYTGMRVGLATMRALAYALKIPALAIASLDAIAVETSENNVRQPRIIVARHAYQGQLYWGEYDGSAQRTAELALAEPETVVAALHGGALLVGDGPERFVQLLSVPGVIQAACERNHASASVLGCMGLERYRGGLRQEPAAWIPLYFRPALVKPRALGKEKTENGQCRS